MEGLLIVHEHGKLELALLYRLPCLLSREQVILTSSYSKSPMPSTSCRLSGRCSSPSALTCSHSPGDYLKPDESDIEGLQTRLHHRLGAPSAAAEADSSSAELNDGDKRGPGDWEISDLLAQWWRPNFEGFMVTRGWTSRALMADLCLASRSTLTSLRASPPILGVLRAKF